MPSPRRSGRGSLRRTSPGRTPGPPSAVEIPGLLERADFLGIDLVAEDDVVDDVRLADRFADELAGADGGETEQQQHTREARSHPPRVAVGSQSTAARTPRSSPRRSGRSKGSPPKKCT